MFHQNSFNILMYVFEKHVIRPLRYFQEYF